jgi:hypothetical protein
MTRANDMNLGNSHQSQKVSVAASRLACRTVTWSLLEVYRSKGPLSGKQDHVIGKYSVDEQRSEEAVYGVTPQRCEKAKLGGEHVTAPRIWKSRARLPGCPGVEPIPPRQ